MLAFIPGRAESGAFVQMLSPEGSRQFTVAELSVENGTVRAGNCLFSAQGCRIELPGVRGSINYGPLTPLRSDIMGPFRFFPMECRHGIISMAHSLRGEIFAEGKRHSFDGGRGYLEKDSGTSFPGAYLWIQCNDFPQPCALMASVARIPFAGAVFPGCICAILYQGREYRFATYRGAQIREVSERSLRVRQGSLRLEMAINPAHRGHPLRAPSDGKMTGIIRESCNAEICVQIWRRERLILSLQSERAVYEYVSSNPEESGVRGFC